MFTSESSSDSDRKCGSQPEIEQLRVLRVVIVLFFLDAGIGKVLDGDVESHVARAVLDHARQLEHRELLGELIEDPELAARGRRQTGQLDTAHRIADVDVAARLPPLPYTVNGCPTAASTQNRFRTVPKISS